MCAAFNRKIGGILLQQQQEARSPLSRGLGGGLEAPGAEGGWRARQRQEPTGEPAPPSLSPAVSQERYTCPSLTLHPREPVFLAQTNGNYLALFSAVWPYRMSRRRRYEGHKVPHLVPSPRGWKVVPHPRRQGTCSPQEHGPSVQATCDFCFLGDPIPCGLMSTQSPGPHLALPWAPAARQGSPGFVGLHGPGAGPFASASFPCGPPQGHRHQGSTARPRARAVLSGPTRATW